MRLTVMARRAFQHDRVLAPLNLGVKVRDGVATVWGPVPDAEVARQAVARLEAIHGIDEVHSELHLRPREKPLLAELGIPRGAPTRIQVAKPVERPTEVGPRVREVAASGGRPGTLPELTAVPMPAAEQAPKRAVVTARPVAIPLHVAVERVRSSNSRFQSIPVEVRGTMVIVGRSGADGEDVTALAQALRRVRGVTEVVVASD
jgi:hypothetical protein